MPPRWAVGVVVNMCGSVAINLGTNLMKLSHKHEKGEMSSHSAHRPQQGGLSRAASRSRSRSEGANTGGGSNGSNGLGVGKSLELELPTGLRRTALGSPRLGQNDGDDHTGAGGGNSVSNETTALLGANDSGSGAQEELGLQNGAAGGLPRDGSSRGDRGGSSGGGGLTRCLKDATHPKRVWYSGAMALVLGSLLNFASMGFAAQSLLASLGSVQFISNVIFGRAILREVITRRIILGTLTIVAGNALVVAFSPHQDSNYDSVQLISFYDVDYKVLLVSEGSAAFSMHMLYLRYKRRRERGQPLLGSELVMPLAYAICSAIVGTQSVIQAKCLSELLSMTFRGDNQMTIPFTYAVLVVWLATTVFWLVRMNRALAQFHGLFIIPALQVFWTFFSVIGGGIYFKEFRDLTEPQVLGFAAGVCVVFGGVYMLAPRSQLDRKASLDGEEEDILLAAAVESGDGTVAAALRRAGSVDAGHGAGAAGAAAGGGAAAAAAAGISRLGRSMSMEAGDEVIDWDHTRMVSFGFFPTVTTDEDMAQLAHPFSPDAVVHRLGAWCDGQNSDDDLGAESSSSAVVEVVSAHSLNRLFDSRGDLDAEAGSGGSGGGSGSGGGGSSGATPATAAVAGAGGAAGPRGKEGGGAARLNGAAADGGGTAGGGGVGSRRNTPPAGDLEGVGPRRNSGAAQTTGAARRRNSATTWEKIG